MTGCCQSVPVTNRAQRHGRVVSSTNLALTGRLSSCSEPRVKTSSFYFELKLVAILKFNHIITAIEPD